MATATPSGEFASLADGLRAQVGERAAGLNGGQVIAGVKDDPHALEELFGAERTL